MRRGTHAGHGRKGVTPLVPCYKKGVPQWPPSAGRSKEGEGIYVIMPPLKAFLSVSYGQDVLAGNIHIYCASRIMIHEEGGRKKREKMEKRKEV